MNIARGQMLFVGPRPIPVALDRELREQAQALVKSERLAAIGELSAGIVPAFRLATRRLRFLRSPSS